MVERTAVFPAGRHSLYAEHRYSAAIRSGDLLFVSGQVGSREDGTPEPDFQQQVRLAFDNLHATLAAAGCTFDDIIDVTSFHTDPENQFEDIMTVIVMIVGIALPFSPLASYLQLQALPLSYFPWLVAILAGYMTLTQLVKGFYSRRYGWQ